MYGSKFFRFLEQKYLQNKKYFKEILLQLPKIFLVTLFSVLFIYLFFNLTKPQTYYVAVTAILAIISALVIVLFRKKSTTLLESFRIISWSLLLFVLITFIIIEPYLKSSLPSSSNSLNVIFLLCIAIFIGYFLYLYIAFTIFYAIYYLYKRIFGNIYEFSIFVISLIITTLFGIFNTSLLYSLISTFLNYISVILGIPIALFGLSGLSLKAQRANVFRASMLWALAAFILSLIFLEFSQATAVQYNPSYLSCINNYNYTIDIGCKFNFISSTMAILFLFSGGYIVLRKIRDLAIGLEKGLN